MGMTVQHDRSAAPASPTDAARDTVGASPNQWPARRLPQSVSGRLPQYQVVMRRSVLNDIRAHGLSSPDVEVCGVVIGNIYRDSAGPFCYVEANIRGNYASGRNAQVTFTSETWNHIHQQMDSRFPDRRIVGWYHTHPGFGIFLSEMDVFIQENFFSQPWQIAFVDDPKGGDRGAFVWRNHSAVREQYLVDEDVPEESPLADTNEPQAPGEAETRSAAQIAGGRENARRRTRLFISLFMLFDLIAIAAIALVVWWWRK